MNGVSRQDAQNNPAAAFGSVLVFLQGSPTQEILDKHLSFVIDFQQINPQEKYQLYEIIGQGGQGKIYRVSCKQTGEMFALKQITPISEIEKRDIYNEITLMMTCRHQNIIQIKEVFFYDYSYWVIQELMQADIYKIIRQQSLEEELIEYVMESIIKALICFHDQHRVHRDIKTDNIMINAEGEIKLGDFGFAIQLTQEITDRKSVV